MTVEESATGRNNGGVTIPKRIRDHLGIDEGTRVTFEIHDDGTVTVSPENDSWELLEEIQPVPRQTDKCVGELLTESKRSWSKYE